MLNHLLEFSKINRDYFLWLEFKNNTQQTQIRASFYNYPVISTWGHGSFQGTDKNTMAFWHNNHIYYNSHVLQPFNFPPFPPLVYILFPLQPGIVKVLLFVCTDLDGLTRGNHLSERRRSTLTQTSVTISWTKYCFSLNEQCLRANM